MKIWNATLKYIDAIVAYKNETAFNLEIIIIINNK